MSDVKSVQLIAVKSEDIDEDMAEEKTENDKQNELNIYGIVCSLIYISVILCVGLPLWWTTTSPSRHSLPDVSALLVHSQTIVHKVPVTVVAVDNKLDREELKSQLSYNWPQRFSADGTVAYEYEWKVRPLVKNEELIFEKHGKQKEIIDVDNELDLLDGHQIKGKLWIFVLDSDSFLIPEQKTHIFGRNRFFYLKNDPKNFGEKSLAEIINDLVESTLILTDNSYNSQRINFLLNPQIDLIVNIVDESEEQTELFLSKVDQIHQFGDIALIKDSGVSELIRFNLNTQILHFVFKDSFISSHLLSNNKTDGRLFDTTHVPLLMNTIESRVVEHNNKQSYHLLVYVPNDKPLYFYDSKSDSKSNLMVTPFRGGVLIWNRPNDFVNGFRSVVRNLIALPDNIPANLVKNEIFFAQWELDSIRRAVIQKQILKTLSSLESISKLIVKVSNIVIIEEISRRMHTAVDLSIQAIDSLSESDLQNAYKLSSKAYLSSETAFFDPSLLSLLYFPDDQKYAVYFPLFLPVSLPVVTSLYHLYKTFVKRK